MMRTSCGRLFACSGVIPALFLLSASAPAAEPWKDTSYRQTFNELMTDGRYAEAEQNARVVLAASESRYGTESIQAALALDMLTEVYFYGDHVRDPVGEQFALRAIAIKEKSLGPEHLQVADSVRMFGVLLETKGDYERARSCFERAVAIYEKNTGQDPRLETYAYQALASILAKMGDFSAARFYFERALSVRLKYFAPETLNTAGLLSDYAGFLRDIGEYEQSRAMFLRAASIFEKKMGADHVILTECLTNFGALLNRMGRPAEAQPVLQRALAIQEKAYGPDHIDIAFTLNQLASSHAAVGEYAVARPLYERAIAIASGVYGPDHPEVARILSGYADLLQRAGDYSAALDAALRTEDMGRNHLRVTIRTLPERQALYYAATRATAMDTLVRIALVYPPARARVYDALVRSRGLVFDEMAARHRVVARDNDADTARLWEALADARRRLSKLVVQGPASFRAKEYAAALDAARAENERAERALAGRSAAFKNEIARRNVGLSEITNTLGPTDALVSFVQYRPAGLSNAHYVAFVQRGSGSSPAVVPLGPSAAIGSLVRRLRAAVDTEARDPGRAVSESTYRAIGGSLRQQVWDPLGPALAQARRVFLAADGELNLVDFAALPARGKAYLIERGPLLHYVSTERDLLRSPASRGSGLLAMGAPAFDRSPHEPQLISAANKPLFRGVPTTCVAFRSLRFPPLPASLREVHDIGALWSRTAGGDVLERTGEAANEFEFLQRAPGRRVLHLAAHAFSIGEVCPSAQLDPVAENPLLLSGIALAGANRRLTAGPRASDGILTAEEIAAMDLDSVEWAVLSACETGTGKPLAGEGVFGLRRAFQVAGARTVITSLWPVDDAATERWMIELYRNRFSEHQTTAEAVRSASVAMLARRRAAGLSTHPFHWSGFIAVGDWR